MWDDKREPKSIMGNRRSAAQVSAGKHRIMHQGRPAESTIAASYRPGPGWWRRTCRSGTCRNGSTCSTTACPWPLGAYRGALIVASHDRPFPRDLGLTRWIEVAR
jgi:hypothetical protein